MSVFDLPIFSCDLTEAFSNINNCTIQNDRLATKREIRDQIEYIGGFHSWEILSDDIKVIVISFLDFKSRYELSKCSKKDNDIEKTVALYLDEISVTGCDSSDENQQDEDKNVYIHLYFGPKQYPYGFIFIRFFYRPNSTYIESSVIFPQYKRLRKQYTIDNREFEDMATEFVDIWLNRCRNTVKSIDLICYPYPIDTSPLIFKNCIKLKVQSDDENILRIWLDKVNQNMQHIQMASRFYTQNIQLSYDFLSNPVVKNAKKLHFTFICQFTDQLFLEMKFRKIYCTKVTITEEAINQYLKRWANGKGNDDWELNITLDTDDIIDIGVLLNGLLAKRWDEEFKREQRIFYERMDYLYMIGSHQYQILNRKVEYTSGSLLICDKRITFIVTGHPFKWKGKTTTIYSR